MNRTPANALAYIKRKLSLKIGFCPFHSKEYHHPITLIQKIFIFFGLIKYQERGELEIIERHKYHFICKNQYPYENAKEAWLIVPHRHTQELTKQEQTELDTIALELDNDKYLVFENIEGLKSVWCKHYHAIKFK